MAEIISFYLDSGTDHAGRKLSEIWAMTDDTLMDTHDVVQWLFPLDEPSEYNSFAPVMTKEQIKSFKTDPRLQKNLLVSFNRFMPVFGLNFKNGEVWQVANRDIWMSMNHNWLRFTRILKSMTMLGLPKEALAFYRFLNRKIGNVESMMYWRVAVGLASGLIEGEKRAYEEDEP